MKQLNNYYGKKLKTAGSKLFSTLIIIISLLLFSGSVKSQSNLLGVDPFVNALYSYTPGIGPWTLQSTTSLTMSGFTIDGANSISYNPQNGLYYIVLKVSAGGGRRLATVDPTTGVCTLVGNLGDNFSSITFTPTGKLYGITGTGSSGNPRSLYVINTTNATKVFKTTLTNGADGQVIAFNPDDGFIYHWSGNLSTVAEQVDTTTFAVTNITESGATHREVFGAVYYKSGAFFVADIDLNVFNFSTTGTYTPMGLTSTLFRGLAYSSYPSCVASSIPIVSSTGSAICSGGSVDISVDDGNLYEATNWQWYSGSCGGSALPAGTTLTVSPTVTTTYYARGEGGCVTSANCASITISVGPPAAPVISGPSVVCGLNTATYTCASTADSYTWTVPSTTGMTLTSGQGTSSITVSIAPASVLGNVTLTLSNTCGNSATTALAVTTKPGQPSPIAGPTSVCGLSSATYSILPTFGATTYQWIVPTGMSITSGQGTTQVIVGITSAFVSGPVKANAINACGYVPGVSITVTAHAPGVPAAISGPLNICGLTAATYSIASVAGATAYQWTVTGGVTINGSSTGTSLAVNFSGSTGTISCAATNVCGTGTARTISLSIAATQPGTIAGPANVCGMLTATYSVSSVAGAVTYNWAVPAGFTITNGSGSNTIFVSIAPSTGTNTVAGVLKVSTTNACGLTSAVRSMNTTRCLDPIAINTINNSVSDATFSPLFPNPTSGEFSIGINSINQQLTLEVYDILGNKIINQKQIVEPGQSVLKSSVQQNKPGMYFVRLIDADANVVYTERLIRD